NTADTYAVSAQNGAGGATSNSLNLTVGTALTISGLNPSPNPPLAGKQFSLTINGGGFDPNTVQILFNGPNCSPCTVPNGVLTTKTGNTMVGPVTLNTAGAYAV